MPNHVTTICTVTGPAAHVAAFADKHIKPEEGRPCFDFGSVIPMPQSILATAERRPSEMGDAHIELYMQALLQNPRLFMLPSDVYPWIPAHVRRWGELRAWLDETKPGVDVWARRALIAAAETGSPGWYEWSKANWGTQWGAYAYKTRDRSEGRFEFQFDTAWSFPEPVFRKLATTWPTLVFAVKSYDEGDCFACVGEFNGANDYRTVECTPELHLAVYGELPATEEEDDEEPAHA